MTTATANILLDRADDKNARGIAQLDRRANNSVSARIGEFHICVSGDHPTAIRDFAMLYQNSRCPTSTVAGAIDLKITPTRRTRLGGRRYAIQCDGETVFDELRSAEVFPYLEWAINYRIIATCHQYVQLHAATLAWNGCGIVLAGRSGAGKSTLAAALVAQGATYLCDEFALIEPQSLTLKPFPKALCVKAGSFGIVRQLGLPLWRRRCHVKALKGAVGYVAPAHLRPALSPVPADLVIFPRFTGERDAKIYPCPPAQAAFSLAASVLNGHHGMERAVEVTERIGRRARCHTVDTGEIASTAQAITRLADTCSQ